jgi:(p)ppGpp synthase/HD superfamily hydrolase
VSIILKAADLARRAHRGQLRKYTGREYVEHPARVAGKVGLLSGATEEMVAAGYLHDVLEDTQARGADIVEATNEDVLEIVMWLTNPSKGRKDLRRDERKALDREHLMKAPAEARVIKLVDRTDNLLEMSVAPWDFRALYAHESILLAEAIGDADPALAEDLIKIAKKLKSEAALP